jgi:guanosine-3',5'-bis(diphosphate) 3'-pyrophosphohydrolase
MSEEGTTPGWLEGSGTLAQAYALAERAHHEQKRKDGVSPYIGHPMAVAERLAAAGLDEATVAAAILHDVVEDSELTVGEIVERFGVGVGELVSALTDDRTITDYEERKREHRARVAAAGPRAAAIYAADKLINVRDMRKLYGELGESAAGRFNAPIDLRVRLWREDLEMVERVAGDLSMVDELRAELDAFEAERSREAADVASP